MCASKHYFYDVVVLGFKQFHSYLYNYKLHTTLFLTTYYYWWWNPLLVFKRKHLLPSSVLLRIVKLFMKKEDKPCRNSLINWRHQTLLVNFDVGKKKKVYKNHEVNVGFHVALLHFYPPTFNIRRPNQISPSHRSKMVFAPV